MMVMIDMEVTKSYIDKKKREKRILGVLNPPNVN